MQSFYDAYSASIPASRKKYENAKAVIPGGVGSSLRYWAPSPFFVKEAKGAYLWDIDGNKYIDFSM